MVKDVHLLYADDTVLTRESELNMQKALDATAECCMEKYEN